MDAVNEALNKVMSKSTHTVGVALPHESAHLHVTGDAQYCDDLPEPRNLLHAYMGLATHTHARVTRLDLSKVRSAKGVKAVVSAVDLAATTNDIGCAGPGDLVFADGEVNFYGQPLFAVAATSREAARRATTLAEVDYEDLPAILTIEEALAAHSELEEPIEWTRGEPEKAIAAAPHKQEGRIRIGGQEHFYLEGQNSMAIPQEDGQMLVYTSTQGLADMQRKVAAVLGVVNSEVTVQTRRMGGGFGGKETQAAWFACIAAWLARKAGQPVKIRLDRDDDMTVTGKRCSFLIDYKVGFDDEGRIQGIDVMQALDGGYALDLSHAVAGRAMHHADNAYFLENIHLSSHRCRTHTVSNTAFRGFGAPQGVLCIEEIVLRIACQLHLDPLDVRKVNFYGIHDRNITPYGMKVEDNLLHTLVPQLERESDYRARRRAIDQFNAEHRYVKKGMALTPVKFGVSFTQTFMNQAGALVLVYLDGSVQLNHGGTEMGQGIFIKVAQVVAEVLGVSLDRIRTTPTTTGKVPNTSATSASTGADLNGAAAYNAAKQIIDRLVPLVRKHYSVANDIAVQFHDNGVYAGDKRLASFKEVVNVAYMNRVQLSAAGYYATPKIYADELGRGRPFYYFAYGAACTEVVVDTLTGENRMLRVDLLHDVGKSLNPAIDLGQIEGGFVQGAGWLTTEELWWDPKGRLGTHAPSTYKIPVASDLAPHFNARIYERGNNVENAIFHSKAVGEPPLMLAVSVLQAIKDAVAAVADHKWAPNLDAPATPEAVLMAVEGIKERSAKESGATETESRSSVSVETTLA